MAVGWWRLVEIWLLVSANIWINDNNRRNLYVIYWIYCTYYKIYKIPKTKNCFLGILEEISPYFFPHVWRVASAEVAIICLMNWWTSAETTNVIDEPWFWSWLFEKHSWWSIYLYNIYIYIIIHSQTSLRYDLSRDLLKKDDSERVRAAIFI